MEKQQQILNRGFDLDQLGPERPRRRVMIVDDEPESVKLLKMVMINAGMDVIGATSGPEALRKASELQPDLVLLDLMMPEMDGWETFEQLRKITGAPVIIVSAIADKEQVVRGLRIGADDYLTKPYHPAELVMRIEKALERGAPARASRALGFPEHDLYLNLESREVRLRGETLYLPRKVFSLLAILARYAPEMVSNEDIAVELWGSKDVEYQKRIKYLIFILRKHLEVDPANPAIIMTWGSFGYRLAGGQERKLRR